jgi:hypothetical protein
VAWLKKLGDDAEDVTRDFVSRVGMLVLFLINVIVDLGFLAGWVWAHSWAEANIFAKLEVKGTDKFSLNILKICFTAATLIPVAAFVAADVAVTVRRIWQRAFATPAKDSRP